MFSGYTFKVRAPPQLTHYSIEEPKSDTYIWNGCPPLTLN